jgi:hypothetical protein
MLRFAAAIFVLYVVSAAAAHANPGENEFTMPSRNVGCVYTPAGGTGTYQSPDGLAELQCDRVEPTYVRVVLGATGPAHRFNNVGDASCCGEDYILEYGEMWQQGPFTCLSATTGLVCTRGHHGFSISRRSIKTY